MGRSLRWGSLFTLALLLVEFLERSSHSSVSWVRVFVKWFKCVTIHNHCKWLLAKKRNSSLSFTRITMHSCHWIWTSWKLWRLYTSFKPCLNSNEVVKDHKEKWINLLWKTWISTRQLKTCRRIREMGSRTRAIRMKSMMMSTCLRCMLFRTSRIRAMGVSITQGQLTRVWLRSPFTATKWTRIGITSYWTILTTSTTMRVGRLIWLTMELWMCLDLTTIST